MTVIRGRVVNTRRRDDGTFAVTLVGALSERSFLWFLSSRPVRLGSLVEFSDPELRKFEASAGSGRCSVTILEGGSMRCLPDRYQRRFVAPQWLQAVARASWLPLYPHQIEGAAWAAERLAMRRGVGLLDEQGLGKTLQVGCALLVSRALPAIVVCPSSLKQTWKRELSHLRVALDVHVVDGTRGPLPAAHVLVVNYDLLRVREGQLGSIGARAIVFDEGHILKEPEPGSGHRAAVATRLAKHIGCAVVTTGTPLPNRPEELWRILHVIDPSEWPSFLSFKGRYCLESGGAEPPEALGRRVVSERGCVSNLDELHAKMAPCILRRLKRQVLPQLPPKTRLVVLAELSAQDMQSYKAAERDVVAWLRKVGGVSRADSAARGQAIVKLQMLRRIAALGKLREAAPRYLKAWFATKRARRLVIFAYHRRVIYGTRAICLRLGLQVCCITGASSYEQRQGAIDRFNAGQADVFIAPILVGGLGLNLQRGAADVLFIERLWVPSLMNQAEDRIHRLGQCSPVTITYLDAANTVDEYVSAVLTEKLRIINQVVDDVQAIEELDRQGLDEVVVALSADAEKAGRGLQARSEAEGGTCVPEPAAAQRHRAGSDGAGCSGDRRAAGAAEQDEPGCAHGSAHEASARSA